MAKSEQQKLKEKLDKVFSQYIRHKYANDKGYVQCYTCSTIKPINEMQNGHWIPRNNLGTRFDEDNCRPQCLTKESKLMLENGEKLNINKVKKGDKVHAFNKKSFHKEIAVVEGVRSFLPDKLYEIEMENGHKFYATEDHKVVVNGEWIEIKDLLHSCIECNIMEL